MPMFVLEKESLVPEADYCELHLPQGAVDLLYVKNLVSCVIQGLLRGVAIPG